MFHEEGLFPPSNRSKKNNLSTQDQLLDNNEKKNQLNGHNLIYLMRGGLSQDNKHQATTHLPKVQ